LAQFLADCGFTHLLLVEAHNPEFAVYDNDLVRRLGEARFQLPLLRQSRFESPGGDRRDYWLYALPPSQPAALENTQVRQVAAIKHELGRMAGRELFRHAEVIGMAGSGSNSSR
jgi:hypothetical protein